MPVTDNQLINKKIWDYVIPTKGCKEDEDLYRSSETDDTDSDESDNTETDETDNED